MLGQKKNLIKFNPASLLPSSIYPILQMNEYCTDPSTVNKRISIEPRAGKIPETRFDATFERGNPRNPKAAAAR